MRNQTKITTPGDLLDKNGVLIQRGYATEPILTYRRKDIKAPPWRIKEWDFYQVMNDAVTYLVLLLSGDSVL